MNEKILIVDDDPVMPQMIGLALQPQGYGILMAPEAREGMAKALAEAPDLIILDVMLPGVSGIELCQQLRAREETSTIPIIMLSAKGGIDDKVAGLKAAADEYVVKPIDMRELVARVEALLERVRRMRAEAAPKAAKLISFVGAKGGVGTTTTVLNTALAMAMQGKAVLAVELRPHVGSFPNMLGLTAQKGLGELLAMEPGSITEHEISTRLYSHSSGLRLLCSPHELLTEARVELAQADAILEAVSGLAEVILIDLAPYPPAAIQSAVQHSSAVILVVEPVKDCVMAGAAMAGFLRSHAGASTVLHLLLVNRAPMASPVAMREVQEKLGFEEARGIPPAVDESTRAQQLGMPLFQSRPDSFTAQAYKELADLLL